MYSLKNGLVLNKFDEFGTIQQYGVSWKMFFFYLMTVNNNNRYLYFEFIFLPPHIHIHMTGRRGGSAGVISQLLCALHIVYKYNM